MPPRTGTTSRRAVAAAGIVTAVLAGMITAPVAAGAQPAADESSRWTLATLPDTQFYSRYAFDQFEPRYGSNPYQVQTEWLGQVQDDLNIPLVAHLGDVVDRATVESEWVAADAAHKALEDAALPYSILPGNHDVRNSASHLTDRDYDLAEEPYLQWFPPERAAAQSTESGRDETGLSEYQIFEAEGQQYLMLALAWRVSDETLAWAEQVMAEHPSLPTILTSHDILGVESDGRTATSGANGDRLWEELIRSNDQIFLTISGHNHGSAYRTMTNDAGNEVFQVLQDWQMAYEGGNGYLGLFEFDLEHDAIHVSAPSPWVAWKPADSLTVYDQPFLEAPNEQFTLGIDFEERFSGFNAGWTAGDSELPSLTQRAREIILDGFEGVPPVTAELPGSTEDYPRLGEDALAHWRPGMAETGEDGVLTEGAAVPDVIGGDDMTRVNIEESGSLTAQPGDVTIRRDGHAFSSDGAGVCFADSSGERYSYLSTAPDAAVNDADFSAGYTIEAFVYLDESWTADQNAWSKAFNRTGNRSRMGMPPSRYDYTTGAASLGFSNLREFQWTELPQDPTVGDKVSWSGEIPLGRWFHVALVNDIDDARTTMYVDGAPILRNATGTGGMSFEEGMPWIIGAAWESDQASNGWHGCVGELRIADRPTDQAEWLIHRPDVDDFTADAERVEVAEGEALPALTGTGKPGATVVAEGAVTGEAVVTEDGTWTLEGELDADAAATGTAHQAALDAAPGTYAFSLTHGFGERRSEARAGEVVVLADDDASTPAPEPTEPGGEPTEPGGEPTEPGGQPGEPGQPGGDQTPDPTTDPGAPGQPGGEPSRDASPQPGGPGSGPGAGDGKPLPRTGSDVLAMSLAALALLGLGGGAVYLARRRGSEG